MLRHSLVPGQRPPAPLNRHFSPTFALEFQNRTPTTRPAGPLTNLQAAEATPCRAITVTGDAIDGIGTGTIEEGPGCTAHQTGVLASLIWYCVAGTVEAIAACPQPALVGMPVAKWAGSR